MKSLKSSRGGAENAGGFLLSACDMIFQSTLNGSMFYR
jgi:hypothetical protein